VADHAHTFSASKFEQLMLCPGSAVLTANAPRTSSAYAAEGTCIHEQAALVLHGTNWPAIGTEFQVDGHTVVWTQDMQDCGQHYVDYVLGLNGDSLWVEQRVSFAAPLGIPPDADDGFGTADAIVAKGSELIVIDLKTGRGVDVDATENPQLMLYALGALELLDGVAGDFDTVRCVIVQPRAGGVKEWVTSKADLYAWARGPGAEAVQRVRAAMTDKHDEWAEDYLSPGEAQCKFCPAKATCPALRDAVADTVLAVTPASPDEFAAQCDAMAPEIGTTEKPADAAWLAACLTKVDLIEDWCKAVRAEAERRLLAGEPVPGFKLVQGKKGDRAWVDATEVEKLFKETFRLKTEEMYDLKLISPTSAEKLQKAKVIGPRQWAKVNGLITRSEGKPHVAPASDPRPAIEVKPVVEEFSDLTDLA
jgi:hypothetical protein